MYTGIRPGEKLFEELSIDPDRMDRTTHDKIFVAPDAMMVPDAFEDRYEELVARAFLEHVVDVRLSLKRIIPTYAHPEVPDNVVAISGKTITSEQDAINSSRTK